MVNLSSLSVRQETFASLAARWNRLWPGPAAHPIFSGPDWHETWWRHFSDGYDLLLLAISRADTLLAVAPFKRRGGTVSFVADADVTDFLDIVVDPAAQSIAFDALIAFLTDDRGQELDLPALRPDSAALAELPGRLKQAGWTVTVLDEDTSPAVDLPSTWDDYLARLSAKDRHELRRKARRLNDQAGVQLVGLTARAEIESHLDAFFRLHRLSRPEKAAFMTAPMEAYFRDLLGIFADRGQVRLDFLDVGGVHVAAAVSFETKQEVLLYNSGYDPAYSHLSVGLLLKAFGVEQAIVRGKARYDFLRGNERYKYDLGAHDVPIRRLIARRGSG